MCSKYGTLHFDGKSEAIKSSRFAIAYATELASAGNPASWIYHDNSPMREHLLYCFESRKVSKIGKEDHSSWDKTEEVKTADIAMQSAL